MKKHKSAFRQLLNEMNQMEQRMDANCADSERLKMETALIVAETKIIKAHIEENPACLEESINQLSNRV